jgi:hypothetical protein
MSMQTGIAVAATKQATLLRPQRVDSCYDTTTKEMFYRRHSIQCDWRYKVILRAGVSSHGAVHVLDSDCASSIEI